jgi:hypothetical protein
MDLHPPDLVDHLIDGPHQHDRCQDQHRAAHDGEVGRLLAELEGIGGNDLARLLRKKIVEQKTPQRIRETL